MAGTGVIGDETLLLCGGTRFTPPDHPLIEALPRTLLVRSQDGDDADWITSTLRVMGIEATHQQPGSSTVVTRLVDILVIRAVRAWLQSEEQPADGWLAAVRDPHLGRALVATVRAGCAVDGQGPGNQATDVSRLVLCAVRRRPGMAPMQYVTRHPYERRHRARCASRDRRQSRRPSRSDTVRSPPSAALTSAHAASAPRTPAPPEPSRFKAERP